MYIIKCPVCKSTHTIKYGKRNNIQLYKCVNCNYQFRNIQEVSLIDLWDKYQNGKQTIKELSTFYKVSESTIKRLLQKIKKEWNQPPLKGSGFVHLDVTYWGHNFGVFLAIDSATGKVLYMAFVKNETIQDYKNAIESITERGYIIRGIIIDGKQHLFKIFSNYPIQMCQYHMIQIVKRYLTNNPKMHVSKELKELIGRLTTIKKCDFENEYNSWESKWEKTLNRRSLLKSGKTTYTHRRLRSAMNSIDFYLDFLFTYQKEECKGMPNTNNKIEGTFTDLKKKLNNHSGLSIENRKRFICGFFLALNDD